MSDFSRITMGDPAPRRSFQHGQSRRVVEVSFNEYHMRKNEILTKIHNRLLWLSLAAILFGTIELVLYLIIKYKLLESNVLYRKPCLGVPLYSIYMVYWAACAVVSAHGLHLYNGWRKQLECGTNAVMHCRVFEILSAAWTGIAFWLLVSKFVVFGVLDLSVLGANAQNIEYAVATGTVSVHLIVCPWLLRTVHSKTTQIDDLFASEFLGKTRIKHVDVAPMVDRLDDIASAPPRNDSDSDDHGEEKADESPSEHASSEDAAVEATSFALDTKRSMKKAVFWDLWKSVDVAGSFSCNFKNTPSVAAIKAHVTKHGFHVASQNESKDVLEVYLYAHALGAETPFVAEFVFVYSRQFFQSTFKCRDKIAAAEFVKHFQLQELMETYDD
ncbi:hypothetical protein SPRG_07485 [Saprolegnia parasitica CBS 223.65]|uniref:Beta-adaptin appendage C-terminal subdomain domain-containing protein n=1 Tax=Saprolegnia parasitica (strain CBS 223.65) TaxID=695850 RepID=A0A067CL19_SAPPC|nr:hypothetical protein SPRG_07485 [Saprolegnia parasitica CBS 223.65]KDO27236.1 hypothetical protein SPRG_07485 [Saprolegnia parasitica CBS 223.65]|eukprot:XP_012202013.1 hypothetical protein SPRG_07485 [Saprolegnia parasitica CBS 223.65]